MISPWLVGLLGKEKQKVTHPIISKKTSLSFYRKTDALSRGWAVAVPGCDDFQAESLILAPIDLAVEGRLWLLLWDLHANWGASFLVGFLFWGRLIISPGMGGVVA